MARGDIFDILDEKWKVGKEFPESGQDAQKIRQALSDLSDAVFEISTSNP